MLKILKDWLLIFKKSVKNTIYHEGVEYAGYMAFLIMLSIFPFLIFCVAIIGYFGASIGHQTEANIIRILHSLIAEGEIGYVMDALKPRIDEIIQNPPQEFVTLAIIGIIWTASSIFDALRNILNKAYRIKAKRTYIARRIMSVIEFFIAVAFVMIILAALLVLPVFFSFMEKYFNVMSYYVSVRRIPEFLILFNSDTKQFRSVLLGVFSIILIFSLYCLLPSIRQKISESIFGTILTFLFWNILSYAMKFYISYFPQINFIYGSITGIIVALLSFYFCSLAFIFGAELNYSIAQYRKKTLQNE